MGASAAALIVCDADRAQLKEGRDAARQTDTFAVRRAVMLWRDWGIPHHEYNDKLKRGWANKEMAKLLLPGRTPYSP